MTLLIISIVLLIIAGIGKAVMDTLQFHFSTSVFKNLVLNYWWNPSISWRNKYKNKDPEQGEAFLGSTTVFCFLTDAWHFAQFIYLRSIMAVVVLFCTSDALSFIPSVSLWLKYCIAYVALSVLFNCTFELFYSQIFKRK